MYSIDPADWIKYWGSYSSVEMQSMYSIDPADWIKYWISIKYQYLKIFNCARIKLLVLDSNNWNPLTAAKGEVASLKCIQQTIRLQIINI